MSGTPMKDGVDELASIMNLILPTGPMQLPTEEAFIDEYFNTVLDDGMEIRRIKSSKIDDLKSRLKGRVSYLAAMQSDVKRVFKGKPYPPLKIFPVTIDRMRKHQTTSYIKAYNNDLYEEKGVYSQSRQASLFVFPNGSYGEEGFTKYVKKINIGVVKRKDGKKSNLYTYKLDSELHDAILGGSNEETLKNLGKYSSKYEESIRTILEAQKNGKSVFIYNEFIQGSGLLLFGAILELFGFSRATGNESNGSKKPRYTSLTSFTVSDKSIKRIIDRFNQPDNMHGKIINVILGSRKVSEGFTFKNIQVEDIQTPWFNYSEISQALARGYRLGSHKMLLETGTIPQLDIYQRVSLPDTDDTPSIDLDMYSISQNKDISIKGCRENFKRICVGLSVKL